MTRFCPLASGSRGNSIFLETDDKTKFLIDAGLSAKALTARLALLDVDIKDIQAIFVTHEHADHTYAIRLLAKKYNIPIIANLETAKILQSDTSEVLPFKIFTTDESFFFAGVNIKTFRIRHDAQEPVGFTFSFDNIKIAIATDLGEVTPTVTEELKNATILYVEANHCPELVQLSPRPEYYKWRVLSPVGHLSNEEAGHLIASVFHNDLKKVYLAHLSSGCNTPETAKRQVSEVLTKYQISLPVSIAPQETAGEMTIIS